MSESSFHDSPHLTETEARQGFRGRHVLVVLIISVALAVIALAATWGFRARQLGAADANHAARMSSSQTLGGASAPSNTPGAVQGGAQSAP